MTLDSELQCQDHNETYRKKKEKCSSVVAKYCMKIKPVEYFQMRLTGVCSVMYVQEEYAFMQSVVCLNLRK